MHELSAVVKVVTNTLSFLQLLTSSSRLRFTPQHETALNAHCPVYLTVRGSRGKTTEKGFLKIAVSPSFSEIGV